MTPSHPEHGPGADPRESAFRSIDEELRFHIEERVEALVASGMPEAEARARVSSEFGNLERIREECRRADEARLRRDVRRHAMTGLWSDIRGGARRLARSPGHVAVAVATLALGVGASVAMFAVVNAVVLRPLPYAEPERVVELWPGMNVNIAGSRELAASMPSVTAATGISQWGLTFRDAGEATVLQAEVADAGYFEALGVRPILGRPFRADETEPGGAQVVLLSHALWRSRFGGDPGVVGRRIRLEGYPAIRSEAQYREVIGVMPEGFRPVNHGADVWIPFRMAPGRTVATDSAWYVNDMIARLAPGATLERAQAEMRTAAQRLRAEYGNLIDPEQVESATVARLSDSLVGDVRGALWLLLGAVGLVLLIACANLGNLLLARANQHRRNLAVRTALGATRARLVRMQLVESALLSLLGGALGVLLATALLGGLAVAEHSGLPRTTALSVDGRVLVFALLVCVGATFLFGLLPALRASGGVEADLQASRGGSARRSQHRLSRVLVAAELALAMVLVTAAGLMLNSFRQLQSVDPGLDASDVLAVQVAPSPAEYSGERGRVFLGELAGRLAALPGVERVSGIHLLPFTENNWDFPYLAEGHAPPADAPLPSANFRAVLPGYFETMEIPVLEGRALTEADQTGERVVVINRALARDLWPAEDAVGRTIRIFGNLAHRVVGVVGDVHQHALDREPRPEIYVPHGQWGYITSMVLMVEGSGADAGLGETVRAVVRSMDPGVPVVDVRPLQDVLGDSMARRRFFAGVLAFFGILALVLGAVGVYGVMSSLVVGRLRDYGVRLALGASPRAVVREAVASSVAPAAIGLAVGTLGAAATARLVEGLLFGVGALDLPTYGAVLATLAAVALLASWLPARRAGRVDPVKVLQGE